MLSWPHPLLSCVQVRLPDVEFFVNLGDWPLEKRKPSDNDLHPIFSWCGSNNTRDIVMPTYDLTESVLETMGRWVSRGHGSPHRHSRGAGHTMFKKHLAVLLNMLLFLVLNTY